MVVGIFPNASDVSTKIRKASFPHFLESPSHWILPSRARMPLAFSRRMISRNAKSMSSFLVFFLTLC